MKSHFQINENFSLIGYHIIDNTLFITTQGETIPLYVYLNDF